MSTDATSRRHVPDIRIRRGSAASILKDLPAKKFLSFYASRFSTVEINNTFYRMPSAKLVRSWADEVPDTFIFAIKAPQRITHHKRLKECEEPLASLFDAIEPLAGKQGPILFQLPPNFKKDVPRLQAFLAAMPKRCRAAFEFRHESWLADDTYATLRAAGVALCITDTEESSTPLISTAKWGYLRLRREDYVKSDIRKWERRYRRKTGIPRSFTSSTRTKRKAPPTRPY